MENSGPGLRGPAGIAERREVRGEEGRKGWIRRRKRAGIEREEGEWDRGGVAKCCQEAETFRKEEKKVSL